MIPEIAAHLKNKQYDDMAIKLADMSKFPGQLHIAYQLKTLMHYEQQHWKEAIEAAEEVIKNLPATEDKPAFLANTFISKGVSHMRLEQYALAIEPFLVLYKRQPQQALLVVTNLAVSANHLDQLGDNENAIKAYSESIRIAKESNQTKDLHMYHSNLGVLYLKLGRKEEAIENFKHALDIKADHPAALQNMGVLLIEAGDYAGALKYLTGDDGDSQYNRAQCFLKQNKDAEAIEAYEKALPQLKDEIRLQNIHSNLAALYDRGGKYDKAEQHCQQSLKIKEDAATFYNLGVALNHQKKIDEAIKAYEQAVRLNQTHADALINLGALYHGKKNWEQAILYYQLAVGLKDSSIAYSNLGEAQKQIKSPDAMSSFDKAIALDKFNALAMTNKAQLLIQQNQKKQAMELLHHVDEMIQDPKNADHLKTLDQANLAYIKNSVKQIIEIEREFERERKKFEDLANKQNQQDPEVKKLMEAMAELEKRRDQDLGSALDTNGQKISIAERMRLFKEEQANLYKRMEENANKITEIEEKAEVEAAVIQQVEKKVSKLEQVLEALDAKKKAQVTETYKKWKEDEQYTDAYEYSKAFYWLFINYCDAQRIASTGVGVVDKEAAVDGNVSMGVGIAQKLLGAATEVPVFGGIFAMINKAVDGVYGAYVDKKSEDRMNAINKVIQQNPKVNSQEEWSLLVALAAQKVAIRKHEAGIFKQKQYDRDHPPEKGTIGKLAAWFSDTFDSIKAKALGDKIELNEGVGGQEAVGDLVLILAFILKHHEKMIDKKRELEDIIADVIYNVKPSPDYQAMLDEIAKEQAEEELKKNPPKKEADRTDNSSCCVIM